MRQLSLNLVDQSYNIYIDNNLFEHSIIENHSFKNDFSLRDVFLGDNILILSNDIIAGLYLEKIKSSFRAKKIHVFLLPDGEIQKNMQNYAKVLDYLIENKFRRNDALVALGGGVIGDLGGFIASSYQRGMKFIQVPTSLLAQVDSSVGGKTAINHAGGKNLIGAFYQPNAVLISVDFLDSLPDREYLSGFAEIVKYAILGESKIENILLTQREKILSKDKSTLQELIYYSCAKKAQVVAADEKENGSRALLNLGHTFAHAIEKVSNYKEYLHGEAVAIGIHMAIDFSLRKDLITQANAEKFRSLLSLIGLPDRVSSPLDLEEILASMVLDKKNLSKKYRLILPTNNKCIIYEEDNVELIKQVINKRLS